jgi:hypothetical protein
MSGDVHETCEALGHDDHATYEDADGRQWVCDRCDGFRIGMATNADGDQVSHLLTASEASTLSAALAVPATPADEPERAKRIAERTQAVNVESVSWAVAHLLRAARSKIGVDAQTEQVADNAFAVLTHLASPSAVPEVPNGDHDPGWEIHEPEDGRFREAAAVPDELGHLRRWKAEALTVLAEWDRVHEALGSPGRLGQSKAAACVAEIAHLLPEETTDDR